MIRVFACERGNGSFLRRERGNKMRECPEGRMEGKGRLSIKHGNEPHFTHKSSRTRERDSERIRNHLVGTVKAPGNSENGGRSEHS